MGVTGGQVVRRFAGPSTLSFEVDLSPDGRTVIAGSSHGTVSLWDMESAQLIHRLVTDQPIMAVTFSPDGRRALIGTGYRFAQQIEPGHIILWDVETGTEIRRLEGQPYVVADVEFSPDGRLAISGGNGAMAILWDLETGEEIRRFDEYWVDSVWPNESFLAVEFTPDGQEVFAAHSSGPIVAWNVNSGELIRQLDGHVGVGATSIIFSADGQRLASGGLDSQILMWDLPQANILKRFSVQGGAAGHVAFSADEGFLFGGGSGSNALWQMDLGQVIRRYGGGYAISPHFTADGRLALIGMHDGAVELWRIDSTLDELLTWTRNNRYLLELSCEQRDLYRIEPLCEEESLAAAP